MRSCREVFILPAFQVPGTVSMEEAMAMADHAISFGKRELKGWFDQAFLVPFDPGKPGHAATDYAR